MKKIIFLTGILLPFGAFSQSSDTTRHQLFVTTAPRLGGITVSNQLVPIKAGSSTITLNQPVVDIGIPLYKNFNTPHPIVIKTGFRYEGLFISNETKISGNNFHSLSIPILLSYSLSRTTNLSLIGLMTVSSDFKQNLRADDILYTAGVRLGFQPSNALRYGVTLTYISNYSGKYLIPIPDIDWTINKKLVLTAVLPSRVSLKYKLTGTQSIGITSAFVSNTYLLNDPQKKQYLNLQQATSGLTYDITACKRWKFSVIAGHTLMQRLETFDMDQKIPLDGFGELNKRKFNISYRENSFILQAAISYEF